MTYSADFVNSKIVDKLRTLHCSYYIVTLVLQVVVRQVMKCISDEMSPVVMSKNFNKGAVDATTHIFWVQPSCTLPIFSKMKI